MSWSDARRARAESEFFRLKDDGDTAWIIIAGEPSVVKRQGMKGGESVRYYLPVITPGGLKTWDMSGKTFDVVAAVPKGGFGERFTVTRHGKAGSTETTYSLDPKPLSDDERDRLAKSGLLLKAAQQQDARDAGGVDDMIPF